METQLVALPPPYLHFLSPLCTRFPVVMSTPKTFWLPSLRRRRVRARARARARPRVRALQPRPTLAPVQRRRRRGVLVEVEAVDLARAETRAASKRTARTSTTRGTFARARGSSSDSSRSADRAALRRAVPPSAATEEGFSSMTSSRQPARNDIARCCAGRGERTRRSRSPVRFPLCSSCPGKGSLDALGRLRENEALSATSRGRSRRDDALKPEEGAGAGRPCALVSAPSRLSKWSVDGSKHLLKREALSATR